VPNVAAPADTFSRTDATSLAQDLPNNSADLLKLLDLRTDEVQALIKEGRQQTPLTSAVRRLVLAAWRLDQYGDLGDRERITQAHALFTAAAADIKAAYASR
jgi:hypothetical protein